MYNFESLEPLGTSKQPPPNYDSLKHSPYDAYILFWKDIQIKDPDGYPVTIKIPVFTHSALGKLDNAMVQNILKIEPLLKYHLTNTKDPQVTLGIMREIYSSSLLNYLLDAGITMDKLNTPLMVKAFYDWTQAKLGQGEMAVNPEGAQLVAFEAIMSKIDKKEDPNFYKKKWAITEILYGNQASLELQTNDVQSIASDISQQIANSNLKLKATNDAVDEQTLKERLISNIQIATLELSRKAKTYGIDIDPFILRPITPGMNTLELYERINSLNESKAKVDLDSQEDTTRENLNFELGELQNSMDADAAFYGIPAPKMGKVDTSTMTLSQLNTHVNTAKSTLSRLQDTGRNKERKESLEEKAKADAKTATNEAGQLALVTNQINLMGKDINASLTALGLPPATITPTGDIFQQRQQLDYLQVKAQELANTQKAVESGDPAAMTKSFNSLTFAKEIKDTLYKKIVESQRQKDLGLKMATVEEEAQRTVAEQEFADKLIASGDINAIRQGLPQISGKNTRIVKELQDALTKLSVGRTGAQKLAAEEIQGLASPFASRPTTSPDITAKAAATGRIGGLSVYTQKMEGTPEEKAKAYLADQANAGQYAGMYPNYQARITVEGQERQESLQQLESEKTKKESEEKTRLQTEWDALVTRVRPRPRVRL